MTPLLYTLARGIKRLSRAAEHLAGLLHAKADRLTIRPTLSTRQLGEIR